MKARRLRSSWSRGGRPHLSSANKVTKPVQQGVGKREWSAEEEDMAVVHRWVILGCMQGGYWMDQFSLTAQ